MTITNATKNYTWIPSKLVSKGATDYHNAVVNTSWHKENIKELIKIVKGKIKYDDIVIDFGAGTGASTIYLLKELKPISTLLLVDNSASWLGKAYEILHSNKHVDFFLLPKEKNDYKALDKIIGKGTADHVVSANTVHLIPNIKKTIEGIYATLKNHGTFTFQSGNIEGINKDDEILKIDDSINMVHDIALKLIRTDNGFSKYKNGLNMRIKQQANQRKFIFPNPRPVKFYLDMLKSAGFKNEVVSYKQIKVNYNDWLKFLRVRRLQTGILPEVGGIKATNQEELDRDAIITKATLNLFKQLKNQNSLADEKAFTAEWVYIHSEK